MPDTAPPDQAQRDRIRSALDATLFVEAGAGSGKTTALVDRIVALVGSGVPLRSVAAITFTEKAAAELRDRVRQTLEREARGTGDAAAPCRAALDQVDAAAVSTLHAFSQRILREHAIEAGLPPRVEVLDEVSSGVEFDRRWQRFFDRLIEDDALGASLLLLMSTGGNDTDLRQIARVFGDNWDLVAERVDRDCPAPATAGLDRFLTEVERICADAHLCEDPGDGLLGILERNADLVRRARAAPDAAEALRILEPSGSGVVFRGTKGKQENWPAGVCARIKADLKAVDAAYLDWRKELQEACLHHLGAALARFTLEAAAARRRDGRLEYHDLLVLARSMLRDSDRGPQVRAALAGKYRHLLLDEFQDTDPIQIEIAVLIASDDPGAGSLPWQDVDVRPGALFFVGDPKQSIYRFRRADIALFLAARSTFGEGEPPVGLTANFRSSEPVLAWVNAVFGELVEAVDDAQPEYVPLEPVRRAPAGGPPVVVFGTAEHPAGSKADDVRAAEAGDVVAAIGTIIGDGWRVGDREGRPAGLGDIAVLLPARTSLPALEKALDHAGIPYRAESSSLVYATREIRDLVTTLRAIDDPSDELAIVTALRSPLFGCGDDDLYEWKQRRGRWNHQAPPPAGAADGDPVGPALEDLRELHRVRQWSSPSELVDRVVRDRRLMEIGYVAGRPRDLWRRVRFVVDQARAWADAEGGSLRGWLDWVEHQSDEGGRVQEAVLPETDDDSVRILTIHAAKGLEFPVTILSGMSSRVSAARGVDVRFPREGGVAYKLSGITTEEYERVKPLDEQMEHHERIRLLYVACTRARDHLLVSAHRPPRSKPVGPAKMSNAELIMGALGAAEGLYEPLPAGAEAEFHVAAPEVAALPPEDEWRREREAAIAAGSRPRTIAATTVAALGESGAGDDPGMDKRPRDLDLPPWQKGRYGNAVGRAVHGVLQTVDLATGDGLGAAAAAQAASEGVVEHEAVIATLARHALTAPCVQAAAAGQYWRETYVAVPVGDSTLEGYIDLLYRSPGGLVVVDYKTAGGADAAEIDARVERYRLQGGSYALAVEAASGEPVARCVFVFLTDAGAVERDIADLAAAVRDAETVVAGLVPSPIAGEMTC